MSTDKVDAREASPLESSAHRKKMYNCAIFLDEPACTELRKCLSFIDALMTRIQPEGYVLVPVEPVIMTSAALDDLLYPAMCGWDNNDIAVEEYSERIWQLLRSHGFSICAFGDITEQAMIAAAQEGT